MIRFRIFGLFAAALFIAGLSVPQAAQAQFSSGYEFLKAVKERDGTKATQLLDKPGSTLINTRDRSTGQTALHMIAERNDTAWAGFLLKRGANPNIRDKEGLTPLMIAVSYRNFDVAEILLRVGAEADLQNNSGETPLIRAVQLKDLPMVRLLLKKGANPDKVDSLAGRSARDYATGDPRMATVLDAIENAGKDQAEPEIKIFGPKLK